MKVSSCNDPKMEAYCKEVRKLEDKFHGLELTHITRQYNEAADELANIASTRGTVPLDSFSRDLLKPSVGLDMGASVEASAPEPVDAIEALLVAVEVIEIEQPHQCSSRPFDWRTPFLDCLIRGELPEGPSYRSTSQIIRDLRRKQRAVPAKPDWDFVVLHHRRGRSKVPRGSTLIGNAF